MKKYIISGVSLLVLIILIYVGLCYYGIFKNPFARRELRLEKTELIIDDIKTISQLFTSSYYTEIVVDTLKLVNGYLYGSNVHELVIVARGTSYVGTDLTSLDSTNIEIIKTETGLECKLVIPSAVIFNTVVNPSGFTIFNDCDCFTMQEVQDTKNRAVEQIEKNALENKILERANLRSVKLFQDLLLGMGYSKVEISIK